MAPRRPTASAGAARTGRGSRGGRHHAPVVLHPSATGHADPVGTTCSWPVRDLVEFLVSAGFTVTEEHNAPGGAHTAPTSRLRGAKASLAGGGAESARE